MKNFAVASALSLGLILGNVGIADAAPKKGGPKIVVLKKHNNTGRNIAIGATAVIIGSAIASQAARASYRGDGMSCRALEIRCDDGANWACRRLEVRDDC